MEYLNSESYRDILSGAAGTAILSQRDPSYLEPVLETLREREAVWNSRSVASAFNLLAVLAAEKEDKTEIRDFIVARVNHPKRTIQSAAIRALGTLGDPMAIAALQTFTNGDPDSPVYKAAEGSIRKIRAAKPQSAEVSTLRKEVMDLQKQNNKLQKQFDELKKQFEAKAPADVEDGEKVAGVEPEKKKRGWFGGSK